MPVLYGWWDRTAHGAVSDEELALGNGRDVHSA